MDNGNGKTGYVPVLHQTVDKRVEGGVKWRVMLYVRSMVAKSRL